MRELDFYTKYSEPICLALGFFDSLHIVHREIFNEAKFLAKDYNAQSAAITFTNNPDDILSHENKLLFTYEERLSLIQETEIDNIIAVKFDEVFKNTPYNEFLDKLFSNFNIKALICGYDYKFGKDGIGNTILLQEYCDKKDVQLKIIKKQTYQGNVISTTWIKNLLMDGYVTCANKLLDTKYIIKGNVIKGRGVGHLHDFPTANIKLPNDKMRICPGVYGTAVEIDSMIYKAVTNYGDKPTFNDSSFTIESYIDDFNGSLYGKEITIYFCEYIRPIKKFKTPEELKQQIEKDKNWRLRTHDQDRTVW